MFFQFFSIIKVNLAAKVMQSAYLSVSIPRFNLILILGKIQDGDHCWWRHRPPVAPPPTSEGH